MWSRKFWCRPCSNAVFNANAGDFKAFLRENPLDYCIAGMIPACFRDNTRPDPSSFGVLRRWTRAEGEAQKVLKNGGLHDSCICLCHPLRPAGADLWCLCGETGVSGLCRHRTHAGNRQCDPGRRSSLSEPAIYHHRLGWCGDRRAVVADAGFSDGPWLLDRRASVWSRWIYRDECLGARQCPGCRCLYARAG